jgi:hypothetical protein
VRGLSDNVLTPRIIPGAVLHEQKIADSFSAVPQDFWHEMQETAKIARLYPGSCAVFAPSRFGFPEWFRLDRVRASCRFVLY